MFWLCESVAFWLEVSEYVGYDVTTGNVIFSWRKFNAVSVGENQMEVSVITYLFITKAKHRFIFSFCQTGHSLEGKRRMIQQ